MMIQLVRKPSSILLYFYFFSRTHTLPFQHETRNTKTQQPRKTTFHCLFACEEEDVRMLRRNICYASRIITTRVN
jgi:hypothetical protein